MSVFDQMLARYVVANENDYRNALHEVMQEVTLAGLYRGGFFQKAAFYGGTCLRIFHGMQRFSEDMDFSLLSKEETFDLENYFPAIFEEFNLLGQKVEIVRKDKTHFGTVESAFLKAGTASYDMALRGGKNIKIKIEVDINPPLEFKTEQKLLLNPYSFMTRCFTLPDLYAGKMHALAFRNWKTRVKGRDWYDFEWYIRAGVPLNFRHLQERIFQFNGVRMDRTHFLNVLKERLANTDVEMVKRDILPFVRDSKSLEIWSNSYFLELADRIQFVAD